jgi:hypothetical protein
MIIVDNAGGKIPHLNKLIGPFPLKRCKNRNCLDKKKISTFVVANQR